MNSGYFIGTAEAVPSRINFRKRPKDYRLSMADYRLPFPIFQAHNSREIEVAMKRFFAFLLLPLALWAQTPPPPANPAPKPKAKKVWTNQDVENIQGGVSVVGSEQAKSDSRSPARTAGRQEKPCASHAWLRAVMMVLRGQGVPPNGGYWNDRIFGGLCKGATVDEIAKAVEGKHTFDNGAQFTVKAEASGDWPQSYAMVAAAQKSRPFIVSYKGEPYLATYVDFIDRVHSNGSHTYNISKVTLTHPLSGAVVLFDVKKPLKIDGTLVLEVSR